MFFHSWIRNNENINTECVPQHFSDTIQSTWHCLLFLSLSTTLWSEWYLLLPFHRWENWGTDRLSGMFRSHSKWPNGDSNSDSSGSRVHTLGWKTRQRTLQVIFEGSFWLLIVSLDSLDVFSLSHQGDVFLCRGADLYSWRGSPCLLHAPHHPQTLPHQRYSFLGFGPIIPKWALGLKQTEHQWLPSKIL